MWFICTYATMQLIGPAVPCAYGKICLMDNGRKIAFEKSDCYAGLSKWQERMWAQYPGITRVQASKLQDGEQPKGEKND